MMVLMLLMFLILVLLGRCNLCVAVGSSLLHHDTGCMQWFLQENLHRLLLDGYSLLHNDSGWMHCVLQEDLHELSMDALFFFTLHLHTCAVAGLMLTCLAASLLTSPALTAGQLCCCYWEDATS
eukprot:5504346-Lingulodinium_polyedra.AAC.1